MIIKSAILKGHEDQVQITSGGEGLEARSSGFPGEYARHSASHQGAGGSGRGKGARKTGSVICLSVCMSSLHASVVTHTCRATCPGIELLWAFKCQKCHVDDEI